MKTSPRRHPAAFTLIELMAVIVIIVILAGIVVNSMGYVNEKQARSKAKVQIDLLSKALEDYKMDMGSYPLTTDKTGTYTSSTGTGTSSILFKHLYWDSDNDNSGVPGDTDQKIYLPELDPANNKLGWTSGTAGAALPITDPWGNQYCYRSATTGTGIVASTNPDGSVKTNPSTENPDFDIWSMGKDGKTKTGTPADSTNKDDIRNF
jgi:general secretion pathway protein G